MASPSSLLLSLTAATLITQSHAFWREACSVVQTGRIDPILSPGQVSGHVHKIAGGSNVDWYSDNTTLPASSCSSCEVQDDKSAYWTPELYYAHSNGTFEEVPNYGMTVYFLAPTAANDTTPVVAFPPGFKMVSGDARLRSYDSDTMTYNNGQPIADRVSFHCIDSSDPNMWEQPYMFRTACDQGMRAQILFQSCWDGVNTYLPDSAHVAYQTEIGNGGCPPDHPVVLPLLFYEVLYWTVDIDQSAGGGEFVFAQGDTTGYGFHGDFLNGWTQDVLETAVENCLSLADNPDGTVSTCSALAASDDVNYARTCPEQPSFVPEPVSGLLNALPGCNPVTSGPDAQPQVVCRVGSTSPVTDSSSAVSSAASTVYFSSTETSTSTIIYYTSSTEISISDVYTSSSSYSDSFPSSTSSSPSSSTTLSIPFYLNSTYTTNVPGGFFPNNTSAANLTATPTSFATVDVTTTFVTVTNPATHDTALTSLTTSTFSTISSIAIATDATAVRRAFFPTNTTNTTTTTTTIVIVTLPTLFPQNTTLTLPLPLLPPFANATNTPAAAFYPFSNSTTTTYSNVTATLTANNSTDPEYTSLVTVTQGSMVSTASMATMTTMTTTTTTMMIELLVPNTTVTDGSTGFITVTTPVPVAVVTTSVSV